MIMKSCPAVQKLCDQGVLWNGTPPASLPGHPAAAVFGIPQIDDVLPLRGLPSAHIHEWALATELCSSENRRWLPPLFLITALLGSSAARAASAKPLLIWIGKRCWPTPHLLMSTFRDRDESSTSRFSSSWQARCLFINPPDKERRLWSILQALRCPLSFAVIADGSGLPSTAHRRLQLAAEAGGSLGIIVRPPWELHDSSPAYTKWLVTPQPTGSARSSLAADTLNWRLALLRLKGSLHNHTGFFSSSDPSALCEWHIQWDKEKNNGKGSLCLVDRAERHLADHTAVA